MIWTAVAGVRYSIEHIRTKRVAVLLGQIWKWCSIVIKSSALLSIWVKNYLGFVLQKSGFYKSFFLSLLLLLLLNNNKLRFVFV
jgi:hypothetical protein